MLSPAAHFANNNEEKESDNNNYFKLGSKTRRYSIIGCIGYEYANPPPCKKFDDVVVSVDAETSTETSTSCLDHHDEVKTCAICLDAVGQKNVASTECGHTYCLSCLFSHLKHSNSCPLCRTPVDQNSKRVLKPLSYSDGIALLDHGLNAYELYDSIEQYVQNAIEVSANPQTDGRNADSIIEDFMILIGGFGFNLLYDTVCHANGGEHNIDQEWVVEMYGDDDDSDDDSDAGSDAGSDDDSDADSDADISGDSGDSGDSDDDDDDDLSKNNIIGFGLPEVPEWMLE